MENAQASLDFNKIGAETGRKFNALESAVAPSLAAEEADSPPSRPIAAGDRVRILRLGSDATVITPPDKDGNMQVLAGIIKMTVKVSEVRLQGRQKAGGESDNHTRTGRLGGRRQPSDLRGMAADEALWMERFIDLAARQHLPAVTIVLAGHGQTARRGQKGLKEK